MALEFTRRSAVVLRKPLGQLESPAKISSLFHLRSEHSAKLKLSP